MTEPRWYEGITRYQWLVLVIASLGWIFDVFEGQIFVATMNDMMPSLLRNTHAHVESNRGEWNGLVGFYNHVMFIVFLLGGGLGGVVFGALSDRIGRARVMILTILTYSLFTCVTAVAQNWWQVGILRFLVAMGIGGEWAVATAMIAETVPDRARARFGAIFHASSVFGTYLATLVAVLVIGNRDMQEYAESVGMPSLTWRVAFVLGVLPALLTLWIRLRLRDPERPPATQDRAAAGRVRDLFSSSLASRTLLGVALASIGLATFWGVHVYGKDTMRDLGRRRILALEQLTPDSPQGEKDAAYAEHNAQIKRFEMLGMFLVTTGGGLGLLAFGPLCEWLGRRGAFLFYHLGGFAAGVTLFQFFAQAEFATLCVALPIFGFLTLGMHAGYAVYFPELYPARLRGAGGGFCFNFGRVIAALILLLTGTLQKELHWTVQNSAIALSGLYLLGLIILVFAPETKGRALPE